MKQLAGFNLMGNLHQLLADDSARADVEVAHLGVAHLPGGQANVRPGRGQQGMGEGCHQAVHMGRASLQDGVAHGVFIDAKAIHDD